MNYQERIERLRARKEAQTMQKLAKNGYMDEDDYARLLTSEYRECPYYQSNDEYKVVRHQM